MSSGDTALLSVGGPVSRRVCRSGSRGSSDRRRHRSSTQAPAPFRGAALQVMMETDATGDTRRSRRILDTVAETVLPALTARA
ncbi:hypothetical protein GCM10023320_10160 [Pseudonocardia adelaidensis]|uniref:TetR family transcriptional regulator n=1 Tax=Pseudonocardia adelaidensis TaxID=648754 RepID=A0ABP9NFH7_9PSEU